MDERRKWNRPNSLLRWVIAVPVVAAGLVTLAEGVALETRNPRTNDEDNEAWCILATGAAITGAGISIPFVRPYLVPLIAIASPLVGYAVVVLLVWSCIVLWAVMHALF